MIAERTPVPAAVGTGVRVEHNRQSVQTVQLAAGPRVTVSEPARIPHRPRPPHPTEAITSDRCSAERPPPAAGRRCPVRDLSDPALSPRAAHRPAAATSAIARAARWNDGPTMIGKVNSISKGCRNMLGFQTKCFPRK